MGAASFTHLKMNENFVYFSLVKSVIRHGIITREEIYPISNKFALKAIWREIIVKSTEGLKWAVNMERGLYSFHPVSNPAIDLEEENKRALFQTLLVRSKKDIEQRYKLRMNKIIEPMYQSLAEEIEKGLKKFKDARLVWQEVYEVLAELKEAIEERDSKLAEEATKASKKGSSSKNDNSTAGPLLKSLQESELRMKKQRQLGQEMDEKVTELHRIIHDSALFHMRELAKLNSHVGNLSSEICMLRRENKKKLTIIKTLNMSMERAKDDD